MACTGCQNSTIQTWSFWRFFCDKQYITQYPDVIPPTTAVPHWAYLNYTVRTHCRRGGMKAHALYFLGLGGRYIRSCARKSRRWCRVTFTGSPDRFFVKHSGKWSNQLFWNPGKRQRGKKTIACGCHRWGGYRWLGRFGRDCCRNLDIPPKACASTGRRKLW